MVQRQLAWSYICQFGHKEFTGKQVVKAVELNSSRTRNLIKTLEELGRIKLLDKGETLLTNRYRVIDASPIPNRFLRKVKTKRPKVHQRLWNSCRVLKVFSMHELCATASAAHATGRRFIRALQKAQLVRLVNSQDDERLYRLNVDLGSQCPEITPDGVKGKGRFYPFKEGV